MKKTQGDLLTQEIKEQAYKCNNYQLNDSIAEILNKYDNSLGSCLLLIDLYHLKIDLEMEFIKHNLTFQSKVITKLITIQLNNYENHTHNYNLAEYLQMYNFINNRRVGDKIFYKTYEEIFNLAEDFVKDIEDRYKDNTELLFINNVITTKTIPHNQSEIRSYQRKISKNEALTSSDKLILEVIKGKNKNIYKCLQNEIINNKHTSETMTGEYELLTEIEPFYFSSVNQNELDYINKDMEKNKFYLGKKDNKSLLSFFKDNRLNIDEEELLGGVTFEGTIGSGVVTFLETLMIQTALKNKGMIYFDTDGWAGSITNIALKLSKLGYASKIIYLEFEKYEKLTIHQITNLIENKYFVFIQMQTTHKYSKEFSTRIDQSIVSFIETIQNLKRENIYYIYTNDISFMEKTMIKLKEKRLDLLKNKIAIINIIRGYKTIDTDYLENMKYRFIMNNEFLNKTQILQRDGSLVNHADIQKEAIKLTSGQFFIIENGNLDNNYETINAPYYYVNRQNEQHLSFNKNVI